MSLVMLNRNWGKVVAEKSNRKNSIVSFLFKQDYSCNVTEIIVGVNKKATP